jgi:hypothetical protein
VTELAALASQLPPLVGAASTMSTLIRHSPVLSYVIRRSVLLLVDVVQLAPPLCAGLTVGTIGTRTNHARSVCAQRMRAVCMLVQHAPSQPPCARHSGTRALAATLRE